VHIEAGNPTPVDTNDRAATEALAKALNGMSDEKRTKALAACEPAQAAQALLTMPVEHREALTPTTSLPLTLRGMTGTDGSVRAPSAGTDPGGIPHRSPRPTGPSSAGGDPGSGSTNRGESFAGAF
jgi:hypothetical protein